MTILQNSQTQFHLSSFFPLLHFRLQKVLSFPLSFAITFQFFSFPLSPEIKCLTFPAPLFRLAIILQIVCYSTFTNCSHLSFSSSCTAYFFCVGTRQRKKGSRRCICGTITPDISDMFVSTIHLAIIFLLDVFLYSQFPIRKYDHCNYPFVKSFFLSIRVLLYSVSRSA